MILGQKAKPLPPCRCQVDFALSWSKRIVPETYWTVGAARIRVGGEFACLRATASVAQSFGLDTRAKCECIRSL